MTSILDRGIEDDILKHHAIINSVKKIMMEGHGKLKWLTQIVLAYQQPIPSVVFLRL